ncbi:hypothetical protein GYB59_14255 [bacterium]|nr:hypothetical protein [bacterium]
MASQAYVKAEVAASAFPVVEVKKRLLVELQKIADQGNTLRPEWEPLLDSKRVVGTVLVLEELFPFKIPPDRVVRKGGYDTVDEASNDMVVRIKKIWDEKSKPKVPR